MQQKATSSYKIRKRNTRTVARPATGFIGNFVGYMLVERGVPLSFVCYFIVTRRHGDCRLLISDSNLHSYIKRLSFSVCAVWLLGVIGMSLECHWNPSLFTLVTLMLSRLIIGNCMSFSATPLGNQWKK
jgi:hypothetical protein